MKLKTINYAPTDKKLDDLCRKVALTRAGFHSELSGISRTILQWHHIMHKPNHRLRWELSNIVILTIQEHARYHEFEKRAWKSDRKIADDLRDKFLKIRGTTEENMMLLKRQSGGVNKIALKIYLELKLKEFEAMNMGGNNERL